MCTHEADYDAQQLYKNLIQYLKTSTCGTIAVSAILCHLTSARLNNDQWRGSTKDFLLHWQDQLCQYDNMVHRQDQLSPAVKRTLLENAVHPLAALCQVKTNSNQHCA